MRSTPTIGRGDAGDLALVRAVPANVGLLDDVFGIGAGAEHAIRQPEEPSPARLELDDGVVLMHHS
jgi:hypothetical protein